MRAAVQSRYGPPAVLQVAEIERPLPGRGDVLVRVGAASVHPGDYFIMTDEPYVVRLVFGLRRPRHGIPGREVFGWSGVRSAISSRRAGPPSGSRTGSVSRPSKGAALPPSNPKERPLKAGEILLGYPDETGDLPPTPDVLGRNGTYIVFRKLHTKVAAYRQYLRARAVDRADEALLGAKMVGRWQSGAPLALVPDRDDPGLGADPQRNNDFGFGDDLRGFKCPAGDGDWYPAELESPKGPYQWQEWTFGWAATDVGRHTIRVGATDAAGNVQPEIPPWNRLGYSNNAIEVPFADVTPN